MSSIDAQIILPDEIWLKVFDYLPLYDRKHIRLTCRRFYEICNCAHLLEFEELIFLGNLNTNAAIESLSSSQRKTWNIKLTQVRLMDDSILIFFQNQGANIRSLEFVHCKITPALLESILKYCENLRRFALHFWIKNFAREEWDYTKGIIHVFDTLRKNGIIRQYVTDFTFVLIKSCLIPAINVLTNEKFNDFFTIFPNMKKLELNLFGTYHDSNFEFGQSSSSATSDTKFLPSSICHQIYKIRHQLEKLSIEYSCYNCYAFKGDCSSFAIFNKIASIEMKNMKSLSLRFLRNPWNYSIMYPILRLEYLTDFQCTIDDDGTNSVSDVLQVILTAAPNLSYLDITVSICSPPCVINKNCFLLLVRSKLRSLNLKQCEPSSPSVAMTNVKTDFDHSSLKDSLLSNHFLTDLSFLCELDSGDPITLLFATFFHSLKRLYVNSFQVQVISTILKHQKKIQYLHFNTRNNNRMEYSSEKSSLQHWLRNEGQLYRTVHNLTHLLVEGSISSEVSEFLLSELEFPKLRSFVILGDFMTPETYNMNSFLQTIQKLTELEYINIRWPFEVSFSLLLSLFRNLSKLRYFLFDALVSIGPWSDLEYRELFQVCPSLRVLDHFIRTNYRQSRVCHLKDALKNDIIKLNPPRYTEPYFIPEKYDWYKLFCT